MSDAPAHRLSVLFPPVKARRDKSTRTSRCVAGRVGEKHQQTGDHGRFEWRHPRWISWTISQQFQENKFAYLSGVKVIRIATQFPWRRLSAADGLRIEPMSSSLLAPLSTCRGSLLLCSGEICRVPSIIPFCADNRPYISKPAP